MLAIFDIDGTVCDTQEVEGRCYAQAFEAIFGFSLETLDWGQLEEPTSSGIVRSLCGERLDIDEKEREFRDLFVGLLKEARPEYPGDFSPIAGAGEFIAGLTDDPTVTVAFATGGFDTEAEFKLRCCGIELHEFPHATSSDTPRRKDIIPLAASRARIELSSAVYFGDAPWDVEACGLIGIPMIGVGRRIETLRELGLGNTFRDFSDPHRVRLAMQESVNRGQR